MATTLALALLAWLAGHAVAAPTAADVVADYIASKSALTPYETNLLAALASGLLLFVSGGVIYLSVVDWRDRRRRRAETSRKP